MALTRARRIAAAGAVALLFGVVGGWALSRSSDGVDAKLTNPGTVPYPTITTNQDLRGEVFGFAAVTDLVTGDRVTPAPTGRPMVVNFWFSTCEPCRREMPVLAAGAQEWSGRVDFLGINPNDNTESATAFLERYAVTYPNYLDDRGDQLATSRVGTMPTTFFLDAAGTVVSMHAGELTTDDLREAVAGLGVQG
ncbi:MAG: TlpA family protein disulfide reductase [Acidimicrobiales bacterium]